MRRRWRQWGGKSAPQGLVWGLLPGMHMLVTVTPPPLFCRHRSELLEAQIASVSKELQGLQSAAADMDALEERYW